MTWYPTATVYSKAFMASTVSVAHVHTIPKLVPTLKRSPKGLIHAHLASRHWAENGNVRADTSAKIRCSMFWPRRPRRFHEPRFWDVDEVGLNLVALTRSSTFAPRNKAVGKVAAVRTSRQGFFGKMAAFCVGFDGLAPQFWDSDKGAQGEAKAVFKLMPWWHDIWAPAWR